MVDEMLDKAARAAIEAMREPTEAMLDLVALDGSATERVLHRAVWRAMLDASLSTQGRGE